VSNTQGLALAHAHAALEAIEEHVIDKEVA
jgi:hypothetical protein